MKPNSIYYGDCLGMLRSMPSNSVDLVFCSPPYENARTYGIGYRLKGQEWVDWCVERYLECVRVCRGLVAWVVEGRTLKFQYTATPALLMADLHRSGVKLRKPPVFHRVGVPGSGGPDWLRNDWEWIVCSTKGKLPWSDNTAMGHPPKWAPGGEMSNRLSDGTRRNQWGAKAGGIHARGANCEIMGGVRPSHVVVSKRDRWGGTGHATGGEGRKANGEHKTRRKKGKMEAMIEERCEPKVAEAIENGIKPGSKLHTKNDGSKMRVQCYDAPVLANPGNVIRCNVGGGVMGDRLCHENEAPFPEDLAEFFIRSFCPPGGLVLDPFCGSGTTPAVASKFNRQYIGIDVRESQVELARKRISRVQKVLVEGA